MWGNLQKAIGLHCSLTKYEPVCLHAMLLSYLCGLFSIKITLIEGKNA